MDLSHMNDAQRAAVLASTDVPLLVLAAAGTGKTETLTTRIAHMIRVRGIPGARVLATTFTKKAAREMQERAMRLIDGDDDGGDDDGGCCGADGFLRDDDEHTGGGGGGSGRAAAADGSMLTIGTFHSVCARVLRMHPDHAGFSILDHAQSMEIVNACCKRLNVTHKPDAVFAQLNAWRNDGLAPHDVPPPPAAPAQSKGSQNDGGGGFLRAALDVYGAYRRACVERGGVDFADLILRVVQLLRADTEFRERLRARWTHVLVDEYQDTNAVQLELVRLLVGDGGRLTVVGDDCQAIHEWRGARVRNILDFPSQFAGTVTVKLERNYRSVENILTAANNVIQNNVVRAPKTLICTLERGEAIQVHAYRDEGDEARGVAATIKDAIASSGARPSDFAVLYRVNAASQSLERAFADAGVPYRLTGSTAFFDRAEVRDALAYLRLAANPRSDGDFKRAVGAPPRGVGAATLDRLAELAATHGPGTSLLEAAAWHHGEVRGRAGEGLRAFLRAVTGVDPPVAAKATQQPPKARTQHVDISRFFVRPSKAAVAEEVAAPPGPAPVASLYTADRAPYDVARAARAILSDGGLVEHLEAHGEQDRVENVHQLLALVEKHSAGRLGGGGGGFDFIEDSSDGAEDGAEVGAEDGAFDGDGDDGGDDGRLTCLRDVLTSLLLSEAAGGGEDDADEEGGEADRVTLMTMHASKGLEFPVVFLVSWCDGMVPFRMALQEGRLEEERRLAYVGITRAKRRLHITHTLMRHMFNGPTPQKPSRFIQEMQPAEVTTHPMQRF